MDKKFSGTIMCEKGSDFAEVLEEAFLNGRILSISSKSAKLVNGDFTVSRSCTEYNDFSGKASVSFELLEVAYPPPKPKSEAKELKAFCKAMNEEFGSVVTLRCSSLSVLQDLLENDVKKKAEAAPKLVKRIEDFLDRMQPIVSWGANS
jgi:hypothetical protein